MNTTIEQLGSFATQSLMHYWNIRTPIQIELNPDLTDVYGEFLASSQHGLVEYRIRLRPDLLSNDYVAERILLHELTHFALYLLRLPFNDGDEFFEAELLRVGAPSSKSAALCSLMNRLPHAPYYFLQCPSCESLVRVTPDMFQRQKQAIHYGCTLCSTPLSLL